MELTYKQCTFETDEELQQLVDLQNEVYEARGLRFTKEEFIHWYVDNPVGKVISFNAFDGDRMVAHQSFVPCLLKAKDRIIKCACSISVVTHPGYQGHGIFSKLTNLGVDYAREQGYEMLIAVPNGNSYPAFVKHAGFTFVTRLDVKIGFGVGVKSKDECTYFNYWTKETLQWRLGIGEYYLKRNLIVGKFKPFVNSFMGCVSDDLKSQIDIKKKGCPFGAQIYVGWGAKLNGVFVKVPKFIKHSPFNFVYKDLTGGQLPPITKENLFFQLIDFDVA